MAQNKGQERPPATVKGFAQSESVFLHRLRSHFGEDPLKFSILTEEFESHEQPNFQLAINHYLGQEGRSAELLGLTGHPVVTHVGTLSMLLAPERGNPLGGMGATEGPVQYANIILDDGQALPCVQCALYIIHDSDRKLAAFVSGPTEGARRKLHVDVMAPERKEAGQFLTDLRTSMRERNVYRGRVVSLFFDEARRIQVQFHSLPVVERDQIILPDGLLARIERQTVGFAKHSRKLLAAGQHLKRGILLHGPPGTGKTLTAMFLASQMKDRTVLLLTGRGMGVIEQSCTMARILQPSVVILEDVDLVAEERTRQQDRGATTLLFELLNQMDGLSDDADVLFLLTTNRPELLEAALAARPGRIDQAIAVPLPDAGCRGRLFHYYGRDLIGQLTDLDRFIERTEGASAAFIRELIRKAALFAADEAGDIRIQDLHLDEALHEIVVQGGELTRTLLGGTLES